MCHDIWMKLGRKQTLNQRGIQQQRSVVNVFPLIRLTYSKPRNDSTVFRGFKKL